jgi:hypothetical protein
MPEDMGTGNPDAAQDEGLIQSVMQRDLGPIFEAIGSRLKDLEEDLGEAKDLLYKFAEGLIGAADNHKRTTLSGELSTKYGKDMEPFEGFYKDTQGKGFSEAILEELMGDGAPGDEERDGYIQNKLAEAKGKYGKYVGIKDEEPPAQGELGLEAPAAPEAAPEEEGDEITKLMTKVKTIGGEKHRLSKASK